MKTFHAFFLVLICIIFSTCTQTKNGTGNFTFQGKIIGQDTGTITMQYGILSTFHKDTAKIINGYFSFQGMIEEPTRAWIDGGDALNKTEIYLEPGVLSATLIKDKFKYIDLKGSKSQKELDRLNKVLESVKNQDSVLLNFVSKNPKSFLTPYYLQLLEAKQAITIDSIKAVYANLDLPVKNSRYGRVIKGVIRKKENTSEGGIVSEFKATDNNGQIITLSQFKGKNVVLMDFWNSPCIPCRKAMPHLKSLYNQYHSRGLEIIAVDCYDKNKDAWLSALIQDSTSMFHHVATFFYTGEIVNEDIFFDFPVLGGVPQTILISKEGKVLGHWSGYSKENEDSLDKKLAETFNI